MHQGHTEQVCNFSVCQTVFSECHQGAACTHAHLQSYRPRKQYRKSPPFKHLLPDLMSVQCSMQGTLPTATMMQYSSNIETAFPPLVSMPATEIRPFQMQHGFLVCTSPFRQAPLPALPIYTCVQPFTNQTSKQALVSGLLTQPQRDLWLP